MASQEEAVPLASLFGYYMDPIRISRQRLMCGKTKNLLFVLSPTTLNEFLERHMSSSFVIQIAIRCPPSLSNSERVSFIHTSMIHTSLCRTVYPTSRGGNCKSFISLANTGAQALFHLQTPTPTCEAPNQYQQCNFLGSCQNERTTTNMKNASARWADF